jgi:hypothetical protein
MATNLQKPDAGRRYQAGLGIIVVSLIAVSVLYVRGNELEDNWSRVSQVCTAGKNSLRVRDIRCRLAGGMLEIGAARYETGPTWFPAGQPPVLWIHRTRRANTSLDLVGSFAFESSPGRVFIAPEGGAPEFKGCDRTVAGSEWEMAFPDWCLLAPPLIIALPLCFPVWRHRFRQRRNRQRAETACLSCGYDLTGNQSGICPECGQTTQRTTS